MPLTDLGQEVTEEEALNDSRLRAEAEKLGQAMASKLLLDVETEIGRRIRATSYDPVARISTREQVKQFRHTLLREVWHVLSPDPVAYVPDRPRDNL